MKTRNEPPQTKQLVLGLVFALAVVVAVAFLSRVAAKLSVMRAMAQRTETVRQ